MNDRKFVDSNILIYGHDVSAGEKHRIAVRLLDELWLTESGVLSPQVLQEFYVNITRKVSKPIAKEEARAVVEDFSAWSSEIGGDDILTAFRIEDEAKISFWDALIVAAAVKVKARTIYSEDLNPGQKISGVTIVNPFKTN